MQEQRSQLDALGALPVAVGFSPADALAPLAQHLDWPWPFLADPKRVLYRRLGLGRARLRQVWTPGTKEIYRRAAAEGRAVKVPVEDPLQLGGNAVVVAGVVVRLWRPASPDARPPVAELLAAVARAASEPGAGAPARGPKKPEPEGPGPE